MQMYHARTRRYGGSGSSQGVDGASGLIGRMSLRAPYADRRTTPVALASETTFTHIAGSMKEMAAKYNDVTRQRFQLPLKTAFVDTMRSVGFPEPEFNFEQRRGFFKVTIAMLVDSISSTVQGDFCDSRDEAEISAIDKALVKLKTLQNVVLVDISARKVKASIRYGREFYLKGCDGLLQIDAMLEMWLSSLDDIELVVGFLEENLQTGNKVQRQFCDAVHTSLLVVKAESSMRIRDLDGRTRALRAEKDEYVACARAAPIFLPQFPKKKILYHDVDALALFLQRLGLPECVYSSETDTNGLCLGCAQLTFLDNHCTMIWAKHHKDSIAKAHNAAAREAIYYLEGQFKYDVAGYNHSASILTDQETFVWKGLYDEIFKLGDDVSNLWGGMVKDLRANIEHHNKAHFDLAQRGRVGSEMAFVQGVNGRLDLAFGKCTETFKSAVLKLESLK